jgi:hypothetical protein
MVSYVLSNSNIATVPSKISAVAACSCSLSLSSNIIGPSAIDLEVTCIYSVLCKLKTSCCRVIILKAFISTLPAPTLAVCIFCIIALELDGQV